MLLSTVILFLHGSIDDNSSSNSSEVQAICLFFQLWQTMMALPDLPVIITSIVSIVGVCLAKIC